MDEYYLVHFLRSETKYFYPRSEFDKTKENWKEKRILVKSWSEHDVVEKISKYPYFRQLFYDKNHSTYTPFILNFVDTDCDTLTLSSDCCLCNDYCVNCKLEETKREKGKYECGHANDYSIQEDEWTKVVEGCIEAEKLVVIPLTELDVIE